GFIPRPTRIAATTLPPRGSADAPAGPVRTLAFSLERCMTSKTEPTIAATTDARTAARRNRRGAGPRAGATGAVTRSSSTAPLADSTERLRVSPGFRADQGDPRRGSARPRDPIGARSRRPKGAEPMRRVIHLATTATAVLLAVASLTGAGRA